MFLKLSNQLKTEKVISFQIKKKFIVMTRTINSNSYYLHRGKNLSIRIKIILMSKILSIYFHR